MYNKYTIYQPITADVSWTNMLFVLAYDDKKELNILVYKVNSPQIRTLYQSIPLGITTVDASMPLTLTCTGEELFTDYAYLVINGQSFMFRSPMEASVKLLPGS